MLVQQIVTITFADGSVIKPEPKDSTKCDPAKLFGVKANDSFKCTVFQPSPDDGHYYAEFVDAPVKAGYLWPAHLDWDRIPPRATAKNGTWFKGKLASSSKLPDNQKAFLDSRSAISIKDIGDKIEDKHIWVKLFTPINGMTEGYIFVGDGTKDKGHWSIPGWKRPGPDYILDNSLVSRFVKYGVLMGYTFDSNPGECNIFYSEGMNLDGSLNNDAPNRWNDLRSVIAFKNKRPYFLFPPVLATTEPGRKYTFRKLNPNGAFRIKFGQYKNVWPIGIHRTPDHIALVQRGELCGHRDLNQDFSRSGDKVFCGSGFGVNQHHGGNANLVGGWSAGCLVGKTVSKHFQFMDVLKRDPRYRANRGYKFGSIIAPGDDIVRKIK